MGRPKKSAEELRLSGAPAHKVAEREREEQGIAEAQQQSRQLDPFKLETFRSVVRRAADTFESRIVFSCPLMLELGNVQFNWRTPAYLTTARAYAQCNRHLPECAEFLADMDSVTPKYLMDPAATESIDKWFKTFAPDPVGWELTTEDVFELVRIIGWKKCDGSPRYDSEFWKCNSFRNVIAQGFKIANQGE